jgi:hypothetical protein
MVRRLANLTRGGNTGFAERLRQINVSRGSAVEYPGKELRLAKIANDLLAERRINVRELGRCYNHPHDGGKRFVDSGGNHRGVVCSETTDKQDTNDGPNTTHSALAA